MGEGNKSDAGTLLLSSIFFPGDSMDALCFVLFYFKFYFTN